MLLCHRCKHETTPDFKWCSKCREWRRKRHFKIFDRERIHQKRYSQSHQHINRAKAKKWRQNHPDKARAGKKQYRANKHKAQGRCSAEQWIARVEYYEWKCVYCKRMLIKQKIMTDETLTQDHRIPLSRGGTHWPANLVPACRSCNSSKSAKIVSIT